MSEQNTRVIVTAAVAAVATGVLAYAVYFDYRRRSQAEFRRELRRNERRVARQEKEAAQADAIAHRRKVKVAVDEAKSEGFPTGSDEKEAYFLEQVQQGELLGADPTKLFDAALAFYKALKVYPTPGDLIQVYDRTVPKPILDILADMIAYDTSLKIGTSFTGNAGGSDAGEMPTVGLD
ncbi:MAS20 protein import receptor [Coniochaeta sp. 2T2.1]|nr:MAS20 protein import receptor [Coniochaeta sp. 2T2.1]